MNLVTGATGIVGIHIMLELLQRGEEVKALYRKDSDRNVVSQVFKYYNAENLLSKIQWCEANILDKDSVDDAMDNIDTIYHTAAMVSFCKKDHALMWATNVDGTSILINSALRHNIKTFCHVSSIGAIGNDANGAVATEDTAWQNNENKSVYSQSKFRQEMEIWRGAEEGLNVVVVNPGVILGPGKLGRSSSLIAQTMQKGTSFYAEGTTGYIDARDLAFAMVELTNKQIYNQRFIVVGCNEKVRTIQTLFAKAFGKKAPYRKATHFILYLAAFTLKIISIFTRKQPALTRESIHAMGGNQIYSSDKLCKTIDISFKNIDDSIENMAKYIIQQKK